MTPIGHSLAGATIGLAATPRATSARRTVITLAVFGREDPEDPDAEIQRITEYTRRNIKERLQTISGVGSVQMIGGQEREVRVWLDSDRLRGYDIQIGQWHESGGGGAGVFDPIAVLSQGGGTSSIIRAGAITGDPQHLRLDNGYRYSSQSCGVHLFPCLVKFYAKLTGGTAQMDQQLTMANVVASGMDPAIPTQSYARFRLFVQSSGDTHWQAQTNDGTAGQEQIAATSLAAGDTDWHWFMIRFNPSASIARFYIDDVLEATLDTAARYPTAGAGPMIYNRRWGGAGQYMHCARVWVVNAHRL